MTTKNIIVAAFGIAFLIYIIAFKVYQIQKHPTWKFVIREFRLAIAERLIYSALRIMPNGKEKVALAKFIVDYVGQQWHMDDKNFSFDHFAKAVSNNIPAFSEAIKKENKDIPSQFEHCTECGHHLFVYGPGQSKVCKKCNHETTYRRIIGNSTFEAADQHGREKEKECLETIHELIGCKSCGGILFTASRLKPEIVCVKCGVPHEAKK